MAESTLPEIKLGPEYYAHCDLKWFGKLFDAASLLRDIKDSGLADFRILYDAKFFIGQGNYAEYTV